MDDDDFNIKFFAPKDKKKCYIWLTAKDNMLDTIITNKSK
jgi:hypothetical protein